MQTATNLSILNNCNPLWLLVVYDIRMLNFLLAHPKKKLSMTMKLGYTWDGMELLMRCFSTFSESQLKKPSKFGTETKQKPNRNISLLELFLTLTLTLTLTTTTTTFPSLLLQKLLRLGRSSPKSCFFPPSIPWKIPPPQKKNAESPECLHLFGRRPGFQEL